MPAHMRRSCPRKACVRLGPTPVCVPVGTLARALVRMRTPCAPVPVAPSAAHCRRQLSLEEDLGSKVLAAKSELFKALWLQGQLIASTVLPLIADSRTSYVGQMQRLEQLAERDADAGAWLTASPPPIPMLFLSRRHLRFFALPRQLW